MAGDIPGATVHPPPDTYWFGLHRRAEDGIHWIRCERPDWGESCRWWQVGELDPVRLARDGFGPGVYRAMWRGEHKNKSRGFSKPFEIAGPKRADPAPANSGPRSPPAQVTPDARVQPMPQALGGLAPLLAHDPGGHLAQTVILLELVDRESEKRHVRMLREHELAMARIHADSELRVRTIESQYRTIGEAQQRLAHEIDTVNREREHQRQLPLVQQIEAMNTRLLELAQAAAEEDGEDDEDEDDEAAAENALARIGEPASDGERVINGIASIMQTFAAFAQTPLGNALAKRVLGEQFPTIGAAPQQDAAE